MSLLLEFKIFGGNPRAMTSPRAQRKSAYPMVASQANDESSKGGTRN